MENKLVKVGKKNDNSMNKQPSEISRWLLLGPQSIGINYLGEGIVRAPDTDGRFGQERHNASHGAWLFTFVINDIVKEKYQRNDARRASRVLAHLSCLREFIPDRQEKLRYCVNRLVKDMDQEFPDDNFKWAQFLINHWDLILFFFKHYQFETVTVSDEHYVLISQHLHHCESMRGA